MPGFNDQIIDEFRANEGRVGGNFEGAPLLLLHSTGAKSGAERISPMMYLPDGDRYVVFASKAGAPTNPDWYHNLKANPQAMIEVGTQTLAGRRDRSGGSGADAGCRTSRPRSTPASPPIRTTPTG